MKKVLRMLPMLPLLALLAFVLSGIIIIKGPWYRDQDGDGCGDPDEVIEVRIKPKGYVNNGDDPDDSNPDDCSSPLMDPSSPFYGVWHP